MAEEHVTTQAPAAKNKRRWIGYAAGAAVVVGIVVAIAVPAPADKVFFMKLEDAVRDGRRCADRVAEFAAAARRWPADAAAAGCAPSARVVAELRAEQGAILVRLRDGGMGGGALVRLDSFQDEAGLKAAAAGDPIRSWRCSSADPEVQKRLPRSCRVDGPR
jgi:hypothetical protein